MVRKTFIFTKLVAMEKVEQTPRPTIVIPEGPCNEQRIQGHKKTNRSMFRPDCEKPFKFPKFDKLE
jgi:hypothetical protein